MKKIQNPKTPPSPAKISVRVTAGARKELFEKTGESEFVISVKDPAERNEANDRVRVLLARHFRVPVSSVRFVSGMRAKKKVFSIA